MPNCVAADSSFVICLHTDLGKMEWLLQLLGIYQFYIGQRILNEIPEEVGTSPEFLSRVTVLEPDYYELLRPLFKRKTSHLADGEYEAIGIAYELEMKGSLRFLIIDEKRARNFVKRNFPQLAKCMNGTIGFIKEAHLTDRKIIAADAINILERILMISESMARGERRPCGLVARDCREIVMPILDKIKETSQGD